MALPRIIITDEIREKNEEHVATHATGLRKTGPKGRQSFTFQFSRLFQGTFPLETQEARPYQTFFADGEASEDGRIDLFRHTPVLRQIRSAPRPRRSPSKP